MPKRSQPSLILPNAPIADAPQAPAASKAAPKSAIPFVWDMVRQTVLEFADPWLWQRQAAPAAISDAALAAMERLVAIINTLRSSQAPLGESLRCWQDETQVVALLPYVSEEAYDVLEVLQQEERSQRSAVSGQQSALSLNANPSPSRPNALTTIEALIPQLLWRIARSDYSLMQLIEGIGAMCWQPEQGWASGMLRLVVMLEADAPTVRWCFDVATGLPAESLLDARAIVQSDEPALPIRQATQAEAQRYSSDAACQVDHQLQAILRLLHTEAIELGAFLQGIAVNVLQPGAAWQAGVLRLRFGFAFSAQVPKTANLEATDPEVTHAFAGSQVNAELIEAELMDETADALQDTVRDTVQERASQSGTLERQLAGALATAQVSIFTVSGRSLHPETLVRVTETTALKHYSQLATRRQIAQRCWHLQSQSIREAEQEQLALIVQAAIVLSQQQREDGLGLLEPMLLLDELIPKLLWATTCSTYDIMQWLGGVPAQVLQPHATWQQGTLCLVAALQIKAANDIDCTLDLATGRSIPANVTPLAAGTIVQATALCQQPTSIDALTAHLQQQLYDRVPACMCLNDDVAIEWLEDVEQDWQVGTMRLSFKLAFIADAC